MLSDDERRRFEQIADSLGEDDNLARLDKKARRKAKKAQKARKAQPARAPKRRRRSVPGWAERRFYERPQRNEGWCPARPSAYEPTRRRSVASTAVPRV